MKKAEVQLANIVPKDFASLLRQALDNIGAHNVNRSKGRIFCVMSVKFEADSLLNGLFTRSKCDFIISNDSDYPMQNGDNCIAIKVFTGASVTISCTSRATLEDALNGLDGNQQVHQKVLPASKKCLFSPIFEGICDCWLRVLMAVVMGSDAWPTGVPNVGISTLSEFMSQLREEQLRSKGSC